MKRCPECRRDYFDDSLLYCLDDGTALLEGPASADEPATAIFPRSDSAPGKTALERETQIYTNGLISKEIKSHKLGTAAVIVTLAILVAGFGYGLYRFFDRDGKENENETGRIANIQTRRLTGDGKTNEAVISPDGKFLVYSKTEGERSSLWIKQILTDSIAPVRTSDELIRFSDLLFSPDGNFVYFNGHGQTRNLPTIYRVPTLGGTPEKVLTNAIAVKFSPDGSKIAFGRFDSAAAETSVFIADPDGTNERKLSSRKGRQFFNSAPSWAPDGRLIAIATGDDDLLPNPDEGVILISIDDGTETELGKTKWVALTAVSWHPSGDSVIVVASDYDGLPGQLWEIAYPSGEPRRLTNNLNGYGGVSITADGDFLITMERYSRSAIWVSPSLDPTDAKPVMPSTGDTWGFTWTPDGRIVYVSDQSGDAEVWIMNADGTDAQQLTRDRIFKNSPDVSADGRYIVYSTPHGLGTLIRIDASGANPVSIASTGIGQDNADVSPDDRWVLYSAWVDGSRRVLRAPLGGGEGQVLTSVEATEPRYSPDGSQFACFLMNEKSLLWDQLAIYPADGGQPAKIFDVPVGTVTDPGPMWTPDGRGITIHVQNGEKVNLWVQPVEGGPLKQLTNFDLPYVARREYSRDGKRIAIVRAEDIRNAVMITGFR